MSSKITSCHMSSPYFKHNEMSWFAGSSLSFYHFCLGTVRKYCRPYCSPSSLLVFTLATLCWCFSPPPACRGSPLVFAHTGLPSVQEPHHSPASAQHRHHHSFAYSLSTPILSLLKVKNSLERGRVATYLLSQHWGA